MIYRYVVIRLSSSYGNLRATPVGPMATAFAKIAGSKTLTPAVLREIGGLGLFIAADGSSADRHTMEQMMKPNHHPQCHGQESNRNLSGHLPACNCGAGMHHPILIDYSPGMENELDPMMEAHLDSKAEHGT